MINYQITYLCSWGSWRRSRSACADVEWDRAPGKNGPWEPVILGAWCGTARSPRESPLADIRQRFWAMLARHGCFGMGTREYRHCFAFGFLRALQKDPRHCLRLQLTEVWIHLLYLRKFFIFISLKNSH